MPDQNPDQEIQTYEERINTAIHNAHNSSIANKILSLMEKQREEDNEVTKHRWVWELLQNAQDSAHENQKIDVEINMIENIENGSLTFKHNGKPFGVNNLVFLINQVTTKERSLELNNENDNVIGKFGTGFLTTHLLSEKVEVTGIVNEQGLEYIPFQLQLDRSGTSIDEILKSVKTSMTVCSEIKTAVPINNFNKKKLNTSFHYNLNNDGIEVAKEGINNLKISLPYTLAFTKSINKVSIKNEKLSYELINTENLNNEIELIKIKKIENGKTKTLHIFKLSNNNTSIAIEVDKKDNKFYINEFDIWLPKLFCVFPLTSTEDFYLPFIINNPEFGVTEPRDGVWLKKDTSPQVIQNREYLLEGLSLYFKLLDYAIENKWENIYNIAKNATPQENTWFSNTWFNESFQKPLREKLLNSPIVKLEDGSRRPIIDIFFPYHSAENVRDKIWDLQNLTNHYIVPAKKDIHNWKKIIWREEQKVGLKEITSFIEDNRDVKSLSTHFNEDETKTIDYLNQYYDLLNFEKKFIENIIAEKYAVIPNQNGVFKKRSELFFDKQIEDALKDVSKILGIDIREKLRDLRITTSSKYKEENDKNGQLTFYAKTQESVIDEINKVLAVGSHENCIEARMLLICLFSKDETFPHQREIIFDLCKTVCPENKIKKIFIKNWSENIWKECDVLMLNYLYVHLCSDKNLETLSNSLNLNLDETLKVINKIIKILITQDRTEILNNKDYNILPDQDGIFSKKDELFLDDGTIDEKLKDILELLDYPIRAELLDKRIFLEMPKNKERNNVFVANKITELVQARFTELNRSESTKQIFNSLLTWFNAKEESEILFPDLYKNKQKLYDDDTIAINIRKADFLDEIVAETGLSQDEIKEKLKELILNPKHEIKNQENKSVVPNKSVSNIDSMPRDTTTEPEPINEETKILIKKKLIELNFNFQNDLGNNSIISNIIHPNGTTISIVAKSARGGLIFFNPLEWITLAEPNNQLFIVVSGNKVVNVSFSDLIKYNDKFHMRFDTEKFSVETKLKAFAQFFQYTKDTHFIFNAPISMSEYLSEFGLDKKNPSARDLTADDKNLLH